MLKQVFQFLIKSIVLIVHNITQTLAPTSYYLLMVRFSLNDSMRMHFLKFIMKFILLKGSSQLKQLTILSKYLPVFRVTRI
jgi:hypothetical protein